MPQLTKTEKHTCLVCQKLISNRGNLKQHLTLPRTSDKKPRCTRLVKVIPGDVWVNDILPYYSTDATLPDLPEYVEVKKSQAKKFPGEKKKIPGEKILVN